MCRRSIRVVTEHINNLLHHVSTFDPIHIQWGLILILSILLYWFFSEISLKITKERSAAVNHRQTDNTMTKRKRTNWQAMIYKTFQSKLMIEQHKPNLKSCVHSGRHFLFLMLHLLCNHLMKYNLKGAT